MACGMNVGTVGILTTPMYSNGTWIVWLTTLMLGGTVVIMPHFGYQSGADQSNRTYLAPKKALQSEL